MIASPPAGKLVIAPVQPKNIPELLRGEPRWLGWWAGPVKASGKFDKFPVDPWTGASVNPLDPANWLTLPQALDAYRRDMAKGIGFVLSDRHPIMMDGKPRYLVAVDFDHCVERMDEHEAQWRELGQPYVELSPSGKGLHFFGLCHTPLRGGNAGDGRELYSSGRFITVTGVNARGTLRDISPGLVALEQRWWPDRAAQAAGLPPQPIVSARRKTAEDVAAVLSMLDHVSSDTDYETWRNIVWAIASTGWQSAPQIAHVWSARAPLRYDASAVDGLLRQFDPSGGITLGTLIHHARQSGWTGRLTHSMETQPALAPPVPPPPPRNLLLTVAQLRQLPPTAYVVRGLLPAHGLAAIYGEPGSGKSFLAIDLAHAIAMGRADWFGFPVRKSPVAYVALEGQGGIRKRMDAVEAHTKVACDAQLRFWCSDLQLLDDKGTDLLAAQIIEVLGTGAVIIIDTLNQASPGADENTSQDMGKIISAAKRLADAVGGLVIFVHHAGKNRTLGLRGHSSLNAAMDAVIEVVKEAAGRKWRVTKAKDDSGAVARDFDLVPYTVGQDALGQITSCAVQQTAHLGAVSKAQIRGKHHKAAIVELRRLLPQPGQVLDYQLALRQVAAVLTTTKGKERDRAKEAIEALISGRHLSLTEGGLRLA